MSCFEYDLKGYFLGELDQVERRALEVHLKSCRDCQEELVKLRMTGTALGSLRDEEMPHKIAFVSDKVFQQHGWGWLWNSAPRLSFVSASILAAAIVVHALIQPAPTASAAQLDAIETRVRSEITRQVEADLLPVLENFEMLQKRATVIYRASLESGSRQ